MIVRDPMVKGGIVAFTNGYRGSELEQDLELNWNDFKLGMS